MSVFSLRTRQKTMDVALTAVVGILAWVMQLTVLNNFEFFGAICNLPLTLTVLWGFIFGSGIPPITSGELKVSSSRSIFVHQLLSGSVSGFLVGALFGAFYASVLPIYPICFPIVGWMAGYFHSRNLNTETLLCIPLVLLATVFAEAIMAWQLWFVGRGEVFMHLSLIALPESLLNALIAPFCYFPLSRWHDLGRQARRSQ